MREEDNGTLTEDSANFFLASCRFFAVPFDTTF
jgi:hypothetical protein